MVIASNNNKNNKDKKDKKGKKLGLLYSPTKVTPPSAFAAKKTNLELIDKEIKTHFGGADCAITRSRNTKEKECCSTTNLISSITNCGNFMTQIAETYTFCKWLATEDGTTSCTALLKARDAVRKMFPETINKLQKGGGGKYDGTSLDCYGITKRDKTFPMAHYFAVLREKDNDVAYIYNAYGSEYIKNPGTSRPILKSQLDVYIQHFNNGEKDVKDEKDKQEFIQLFASNPVDFFDHDTEKLVSATTADNEWSEFIQPNKPYLQIIELHNYQSAIETIMTAIFKNSIEPNQCGGRKQKRKSKRKRRTRRTRRRKRTKTRRRRKK
jgi:hypothetical protein